MRSGHGNPSVCQAHEVAFRQASEAPPRRGEAIFDFFERVISGERVSSKNKRAAMNDLRGVVNDWVRQGVSVPPPQTPRQPQQRPPRTRRAPPPVDPMAEVQRKFTAAKLELGFAADQQITEDMVNQRRKELARRHHPDRGGSVDKMATINAAADFILENGRAA